MEEQVEAASVGKGSAAVGEVADSVEADLVVLSTAGAQRGALMLAPVVLLQRHSLLAFHQDLPLD